MFGTIIEYNIYASNKNQPVPQRQTLAQFNICAFERHKSDYSSHSVVKTNIKTHLTGIKRLDSLIAKIYDHEKNYTRFNRTANSRNFLT